MNSIYYTFLCAINKYIDVAILILNPGDNFNPSSPLYNTIDYR
jgi:hypothetical protein